jgi:hypothetical protein
MFDLKNPRWADADHKTVAADLHGEVVTFLADPALHNYAKILASKVKIAEFNPDVPVPVNRGDDLNTLLAEVRALRGEVAALKKKSAAL